MLAFSRLKAQGTHRPVTSSMFFFVDLQPLGSRDPRKGSPALGHVDVIAVRLDTSCSPGRSPRAGPGRIRSPSIGEWRPIPSFTLRVN
ncbi:hypothetical protein NL676_009086 [Syzygium grande]|nr:hypothetical protein NL676_009086 [Syzygium grande]